MADKKITKKERFAQLYAIVEKSSATDKNELLGFIDHEVELLEKKTSSKGQTKNQRENEEIKAKMLEDFTTFDKPITVTEYEKFVDHTYTMQKITALFTQLVADGKLIKTIDKKKSYFSLAE